MALLFLDSFDHYATADIGKKWDASSGAPAINASGGRHSSGSIDFDASEYVEKNISGTPATLIVAGAFKASSLSVSQDVIKLMDSTSVQVKIRIRTDGKIEAFRDTTSLGVSAAVVFSANTYAHLDCKVTIHNSTGSVLVKSGGVTHLNLTSQDTQTTANAYVTSVRIGGDGTNTVSVDDLYILDTTGTAPQNDQLGDCRIDASVASTDGTYVDFTPLTGSSHKNMVDDATPDGDATYNSSGSVGARDSYGYTTMPDVGGAAIYGVQLNAVMRKDSTGTRQARLFTRPVSTNDFGSSQSLTSSYVNLRNIWERNPATTNLWAETEVNNAQFGVEISS